MREEWRTELEKEKRKHELEVKQLKKELEGKVGEIELRIQKWEQETSEQEKRMEEQKRKHELESKQEKKILEGARQFKELEGKVGKIELSIHKWEQGTSELRERMEEERIGNSRDRKHREEEWETKLEEQKRKHNLEVKKLKGEVLSYPKRFSVSAAVSLHLLKALVSLSFRRRSSVSSTSSCRRFCLIRLAFGVVERLARFFGGIIYLKI